MPERKSNVIHPMFAQPSEWRVRSGAYFRNITLPYIDDNTSLAAQEQRWQEVVGVEPADTHVTLLIPIHNEANTLPSVLGSLALSDIPRSADITLVFFVNGATDDGQSYKIALNHIINAGKNSFFEVDSELQEIDPGLKKFGARSHLGNLKFVLLESTKPSKTNAMNVVNRMASINGSDFTINMDANNWVEPDAIQQMIGAMYRNTSNAVVFGPNAHLASRPSLSAKLIKIITLKYAHTMKNVSDPNKYVIGWLMGWNTAWYEAIGGLYGCAGDDYQISLISRLEGKPTQYVQEAFIWGYVQSNFSELVKIRSRSVYQAFQLLTKFKDESKALKLIYEDAPFMEGFLRRYPRLLVMMIFSPHKSPVTLLKFLVWEYARYQGKQMYDVDPYSQTWEAIESTK